MARDADPAGTDRRAALLLTALALFPGLFTHRGDPRAQAGPSLRFVQGRRVALSPERLQELAPDAKVVLLPPAGSRGGPRKDQKGLPGLLARRVVCGPVERDPKGRPGYRVTVVATPGEKPVRLTEDRTVVVREAGGRFAWRIHFHRQQPGGGRKGPAPRLWMARLAEGLSFAGPANRPVLLVDGDADGRFTTLGGDRLVLTDTGLPPLPLTRHLLFATGGYRLTYAPGGRITWRPLTGPLALVRVEAAYREAVEVEDLILGCEGTWRHVPPRVEAVPVVPGRWYPLSGRLTGGLRFSRPPGPADAAVAIGPAGTGVLRLGASPTLTCRARDRGDRIELAEVRIAGAAGEVYTPDRSVAGEPVTLLAEVVVGQGRRRRTRATETWAPWRITRRGHLVHQPRRVKVGAHWNPLFLHLTIRRGPLAGAEGRRRIR